MYAFHYIFLVWTVADVWTGCYKIIVTGIFLCILDTICTCQCLYTSWIPMSSHQYWLVSDMEIQ